MLFLRIKVVVREGIDWHSSSRFTLRVNIIYLHIYVLVHAIYYYLAGGLKQTPKEINQNPKKKKI